MNARFHYPRARGFVKLAAVAACLVLVSCGGGGGSSAPAGNLSSASNSVIVSIGASPTALTLGQSTTLTWSSSNASACQASDAWSGTVAVSGTQVVTPPAAGSFTYTLSCNGIAGSTSVVVAAAPAIPTVSLSFAPASVQAGQASTLTWSSTNATSCTASGAWAGNQASSGSLAVTPAIAGTYTYTLSCTGAGGGASGSVALGVTDLTGNVTPVVIDSGPAGVGGVINVPFVSVTLCIPGTSTCQTIDHVLLDTGSYGLRIIAPGVLDPALALPAVTGLGGNSVGECAQFVSFSLWGSVRLADVKIAGESAASLPVQLAADTSFTGAPSGCSGALNTVAALGANGILGVGVFKQDCNPNPDCTTLVNNRIYYACTASGCTGTTMPLASQVTNPVAAFATDNNGLALAMPAVASGGATTLTGTLIFGIDTQSNNSIGSATVYAANSSGNFTTTYKGTPLTASFIDSGSNGLFFSDRTIPACSNSSSFSGFYCPAATLSLSADTSSFNGVATGTIPFIIVNPQALSTTIRAAPIGGSLGRGGGSFDWGLPFFFGRTVFVAISGASTLHGPGPYWAYNAIAN